MDTEKLIAMAKILAKPYFIVCIILSILLAVSVGGNVYQATLENEIVIETHSNTESTITQTNSK